MRAYNGPSTVLALLEVIHASRNVTYRRILLSYQTLTETGVHPGSYELDSVSALLYTGSTILIVYSP